MAKWGEGDPRWIVEERPDATNVNNWHWTEKNADAWSKKKLEELFVNQVIESPNVGSIVIEELEKCEGEARVNNRKAKLIFFYEWELKLKWKGHVNGKDEPEVKGNIEIPNLSEEHDDMKDVNIDVNLTTKGPESTVLKEMLRVGDGAKAIRETLKMYVDALKNEYGTSIILPPKDSVPAPKVEHVTDVKLIYKPQKSIENKSDDTKQIPMKNLGISDGSKIWNFDVKDMELTETFKCTGQELYNALTQKEMLQIFTGGEVKMTEAKKGEKFEMIGGNVQGTFLELVPFTKIVQKWRLKAWPDDYFSHVEINIKQSSEDTKLNLIVKQVPEKELENTKMGWRRYYFESIKRVFGFGSSLF